MTPHDEARPAPSVRTLFEELAGLGPEERRQRLAALDGSRPGTARELRGLLAADARADSVLAPLDALAGDPTAPGSPDPCALRGARVHHYDVLESIGAGGMGVVYMAWDTKLHRMVALKILPRGMVQDPLRRERFLHEARAASALDHPAICTIYEINETPAGDMYLAMACYDGATIADRLRSGVFPVADAVRIVARIAAGLARAHAVGVTHRDIKPANIMLVAGDQPKILDFGIAKIAGEDLTGDTNSIFGTAAYMSPERIRGDAVDDRTDIWSLGVLLQEMVTGARPFPGDIPAVLHAILNEDPRPLPAGIDADGGLRRILDRALAKDPAGRYASMDAFESDLRDLLRGSAPVAEPAPSVRAPLPTELTSFIGRETEIAAVRDLLGTARLVTLTGTAGTGKTRLSMRVAEECRDLFADGVTFIPLASVTEANQVAARIATSLGIRQDGDRGIEENLCRQLAAARRLIVLDNFEQILSAAGLVAAILAGCPGVRILVTSRIALRISGEQEYAVPPLAFPAGDPAGDEESLDRYPATTLFLQRARAVRPDWTPDGKDAAAVREICRRLDGLPLAIELAAARIRMFPPDALLKRLGKRLDVLTGGPRDRPARQQTLREAIAWSYNLLQPGEQAFFRRAGVFAGNLSLETAEEVLCGSGIEPLDGIEALLNHSLLARSPSPDGLPRFHLLETIREFALEMLRDGDEEEDTRRRHALYFLERARRAAPELTGPDQAHWLRELTLDYDNIQAAFDWAETRGEAEYGLELGNAVWRFWAVRGFLRQGRDRLRKLLALPGAERNSDARARALNALGSMGHMLGRFEEALPSLEESLAIFRETGNVEQTAVVLNNLGWVTSILARGEQARAINEEALALSRKLGLARGEALACNNLGWCASLRGRHLEALPLHRRNLALRREIGDARGVAYALTSLAWALLDTGRREEAEASLREAMRLLTGIDERQILGLCLDITGVLAAERGEFDTADDWFRRSMEVWDHSGNMWGKTRPLTERIRLLIRRGRIDEAAAELSAMKASLPYSSVPWTALDIHHLEAGLAAAGGRTAEASRLLETVLRRAIELDSVAVLEDGLEDVVMLRIADDGGAESGTGGTDAAGGQTGGGTDASAGGLIDGGTDTTALLSLIAFVDGCRGTSGRVRPPHRADELAPLVERLRRELGDRSAEAEARGRSLSPAEAVDLAFRPAPGRR